MKFKRLRNLPWKTFLYCTLFGLCSAGTVMLMGAVQVKSNELACTEMNVIIYGEEEFIEQKEIENMINTTYGVLVGRTLSSIPIHEMEQALRQIPYVKQATIHADMNGQLKVRIHQRTPLVRIMSRGNRGFYVDQTGLKMPLSRTYVPDVPVANGFIAEYYDNPLENVQSDLVRDLFKLAKFVQGNKVWDDYLARLYVNERQEIELIPKVGQQKIILGDAAHMEDKFQKLLVFYKGIVPTTGLGAYKTVNLKFAGQLVCERNGDFHLDSLASREKKAVIELNNNSINIP